MKKILMAVAVVAAMLCTSCKDTNYCYELTTKASVMGISAEVVTYVWCTENELDAAIQEAKDAVAAGGSAVDVECTYKRTNKAQSECHD